MAITDIEYIRVAAVAADQFIIAASTINPFRKI